MTTITAEKFETFKELNERIRAIEDREISLSGCMGQRYIAAGFGVGKRVTVEGDGVPGNALAAYLDGGEVFVKGNAQDQTGDTMNSGFVVVDGNAGDATGYAMRGGKIYIRGNTGYRTGIHMKAYRELKPVIVAGGRAGSFLGEYQAGGVIILLGLHSDGLPVVGNFCGSGMHGGAMYIRTESLPHVLSPQIHAEKKNGKSIPEIQEILKEYCGVFALDFEKILDSSFFVLTPDEANPYTQMYTADF